MTKKHLKKVEGTTFEDIVNRLEQNHVEYTIVRRPGPKNEYFLDGSIAVPWEERSRFAGYLGAPINSSTHNHSLRAFYYAYHRILPGFDFASLDGAVKFRKGCLVERVTLLCRKYEPAENQL